MDITEFKKTANRKVIHDRPYWRNVSTREVITTWTLLIDTQVFEYTRRDLYTTSGKAHFNSYRVLPIRMTKRKFINQLNK